MHIDLSMNLNGIVPERLTPNASGVGLAPAVETMLNSPLISDLILKSEIDGICGAMGKSTSEGWRLLIARSLIFLERLDPL